MKAIWKTPQRILADCPDHPTLATIFYRLFLLDVVLFVLFWVFALTDRVPELYVPVLIAIMATVSVAMLIMGIPATLHRKREIQGIAQKGSEKLSVPLWLRYTFLKNLWRGL